VSGALAGGARRGGGLLQGAGVLRGDRILPAALVVSLCLHALVLTIHFADPARLDRLLSAPPLEVVLVNARGDRRPVRAQAFAQANLDGGGRQDEGRRSAPLPAMAAERAGDSLEQVRQDVARLEAEQRELLAALARGAPSLARPEASGRTPVAVPADPLARMQAEIAREVSDYQKRPRVHHFMPSVSELRFARYFEDWRGRVERIGNEHYPEEARGRLYGVLRMTVVIDRNGNLVETIIEQSSGSPVLDSAARRIVKLSAPYPAFPPDMARDTDRIEITRSWQFTNGQFAMQAEGAAP
jgi:protein TonB